VTRTHERHFDSSSRVDAKLADWKRRSAAAWRYLVSAAPHPPHLYSASSPTSFMADAECAAVVFRFLAPLALRRAVVDAIGLLPRVSYKMPQRL
jgi:hypothetical protein